MIALKGRFVDPYWDDLDMPSTPGIYAATVAFIYVTLDGARRDTGFLGVGMLVGVHSEHLTHYYIVTNQHIVRDFDSVTIRLNSLVGFRYVTIQKGKFQQNKELDLAIASLLEDSATNFCYVSQNASIKREDIVPLKIGYGTDVLMVSRLDHEGVRYLTRNIPIMRFGNIALPPMYEEKNYLVEMRSIAGHSGSPVLVYPTPFVFGTARQKEEEFAPKLLGINCGHIRESTPVFRHLDGEDFPHAYWRSATNMAISKVVPAWHIFEMLEGKKFKQQRQKAEAKHTSHAKMTEDEVANAMFSSIPKGKKRTLKADGTFEISELTEQEKNRFMKMIAQRPKLEKEK